MALLPGFQAVLVSAVQPLPDTTKLTETGDFSAQMVSGIHQFLKARTAEARAHRDRHWDRNLTSKAAYIQSISENRARFREIIGAVDSRVAVDSLEQIHTTRNPALIAEAERFAVYAVRWAVFEGVHGEGLLLEPKRRPTASVVALPDAAQTPEMVTGLSSELPPTRQFARRLAKAGCRVIVPTLINRRDTWSGNKDLKHFTNQPHREWIYRQAFEMGRHVIGYEVQKVQAAIDWLDAENEGGRSIGVVGYAEGGLIAFYSAAVDQRIDAALVSGYFERRQGLWQEPIYRNVFGLLSRFGDAEIATLIAPRSLIIEHSPVPTIDGPPPPRNGRTGAAPGKWSTPESESVRGEFERAKALLEERPALTKGLSLIAGKEGAPVGPVSAQAVTELLNALGLSRKAPEGGDTSLEDRREPFNPATRQRRQVKELEAYTQRLWRESEPARAEVRAEARGTTPAQWRERSKAYEQSLWKEVIGRLPDPDRRARPRSRQLRETADWTLYEVKLDVWEDVFAWGYLLVPKGIAPDERCPVVVCQHGLEGLPEDVVATDANHEAYHYYKGFAARLAERGFITYAPHNPYRGGDRFRSLQRRANPLGKSLFSVIIGQHQQTLNWLSSLPFVDPDRIGFYGLSYGGETAMRVPALLDDYALSICSADFNEWIWKNVTVNSPYSYMFTGEYEMPEFNLGHTFNYAEMAALIAPRPFMVERGHRDGVAPDKWVAYEYAKVRRLYTELGIPDRTRIEFFDGPHTINAEGTFEFLHRHLDWPMPETRQSR